jgi:hypothetical protein
VGSPLRLAWWFPSQVPSPERRQPYSGPSRFVNRATYPLVPPGIPTVRSFVPVRPVPERSPAGGSPRLKRRVIPRHSPGNPLPCHRSFTAPTTAALSRYRYRAFGATSPPALHTEAPSCALRLRTATAAVGTWSLWLSVTSCLPCWRRADAAGEV